MGCTETLWHKAVVPNHYDDPPFGNDVCRPDMFDVETQNPTQPSGVQHMVKGSASISPVTSTQKRPQICAEEKKIVQPSTVKLGLMNCLSVNNKYDFIVDHILENILDIFLCNSLIYRLSSLKANTLTKNLFMKEFKP